MHARNSEGGPTSRASLCVASRTTSHLEVQLLPLPTPSSLPPFMFPLPSSFSFSVGDTIMSLTQIEFACRFHANDAFMHI